MFEYKKKEISFKDELLDLNKSMAYFTSSAFISKNAKVVFSLLSWDRGSQDEARILEARFSATWEKIIESSG